MALHVNFKSTRSPAAPKRPSTRPRLAPLGLLRWICGHRAQPTDIKLAPTTTAVALDIQSFGSYGSCSTCKHFVSTTQWTQMLIYACRTAIDAQHECWYTMFASLKGRLCAGTETERLSVFRSRTVYSHSNNTTAASRMVLVFMHSLSYGCTKSNARIFPI